MSFTEPASAASPASNAFAYRGFVFYWWVRVLSNFAVQIVSVAVGWMVYEATRDPFDLGLVGLAQFLPALLLVLVTGPVADRYSRRKILFVTLLAEIACTLALFFHGIEAGGRIWPIFAILVGFGIARAFANPASQSLIPNLVPAEALPSAIAWSTSSWQVAAIVGPVVGSLLFGLGASIPFVAAIALFAVSAGLVLLVPKAVRRGVEERASWNTVVAGFRYVWSNPIVLGAISLDLFAVLLGGATALLPAVAKDILEAGPWALGLLRAAPGVGSLAMAGWLAFRPIKDHAGAIMFIAVAGFGAATVVFGLSELTWLSVVALVLVGATDMISVYVRETLIQLATPDAVRGRVNAVNMVFIGASNELGEFRAGTLAAGIGVVPAIVAGGLGSIAIAAIWASLFPSLRKTRQLASAKPPAGEITAGR